MAVPAAVLLGNIPGLELRGELDIRGVGRAVVRDSAGGAAASSAGAGAMAGGLKVVGVDDCGRGRRVCAADVGAIFPGWPVVDAAAAAGDDSDG